MKSSKEDLPGSEERPGFDRLLTKLLSDFITTDLTDIDTVIKQGLETATKYFNVSDCMIGLFDERKNGWGYFYRWSETTGLTTSDDLYNPPAESFPWATKRVLAGHEVRIGDVASSKQLHGRIEKTVFQSLHARSVLIEPLSVKRKIVPGVIALLSTNRKVNWTNKDASQIRLLGDIFANILNEKKEQEERQKREKYITLLSKFTQYAFETLDFRIVLNKISADFLELMEADFCGFGLMDEERKTVTAAGVAGVNSTEFLNIREIPFAGTMTERVLRTGKHLIIENMGATDFKDNVVTKVVPMSTFIVVPIKSGKKRFGSIIVGYLENHEFTKQEIDMCRQAAAQITLSINNIQAYLDNQQHIEEMNTLAIMSTALRKAQSLSEIPGNVNDRVIAMHLAENAALVIYEDPQGSPSLAKGGGKWSSATRERLVSSLSPIIEKVMRTGKVILDDEFNAYSTTPEIQKDESSKHVLGFPLKANLQTLGVFCVASSNAFDEKRISLLNAVSETVANAVYRQSVFDNLQVHLETLRNTKIQLVQSEKLAAIGELVAGVAHELNNPLTTITLSAELLLQQSVNEQDIYDLGKIVSESQRAAKIVKSLLDFSRQRTPERQPVEINQLIKSTTDLVSWELVKNNISWKFEFAENIPLTVADPNQLKQVFINIINNSVQAIKKQGKPGEIRLISEVGKPLFFGKVTSEEDVIRVIFSDNGPGIPPSVLPKIFDPFFTTKGVNEGTGLGLSVCHGIISEHQGHIWAENSDDGGARLIIELPILEPVVSEKDAGTFSTLHVPSSERLLIIEDESAVLEVMLRALMRKGFTVDGVSSGEEGLESLKNSNYSLIICDVRMSGMNGFDFYQEVNRIDPKLAKRIIFTSGDSVKPEYANFIRMTGATFIPKPFELTYLINIVQEKIAEQKNK